MKKNSEKMIKTSEKYRIFEDILSWVAGIEEDDPIPLEVKYIYFILELSSNDIALSYTGSEKKLGIFQRSVYSPLEGEYLFSAALKKIAKKKFDHKKNISNKMIFEMLKSIVFDVASRLDFLRGKEVFFGLNCSSVNE